MNKVFLRGLKWNDRVTIIYDSMSDANDKNACSSWLMYYLGRKMKMNLLQLLSS